MEWKVPFPLHPEDRTLPMVWYIRRFADPERGAGRPDRDERPDARCAVLAHIGCVPRQHADGGRRGADRACAGPDVGHAALHAGAHPWTACATKASPPASGMSGRIIEDMYKILALADSTRTASRSPPPTASRTMKGAEIKGGCGFTDGTAVPPARRARPACSAARRSRSPCRWSRSDDGRSYTQGAVACPELSLAEVFRDTMPEIGALLGADSRIAPDTRAALQALTQSLGQGDLFDVSGELRLLFDGSRTLSLNLFRTCPRRKPGQGRRRMVSLIETTGPAGFEPVTWKLPDHLPVRWNSCDTPGARGAGESRGRGSYLRHAVSLRLVCGGQAGIASVFAALSQLAWCAAPMRPRWPTCWPSPTTTRPT